MSIESTFDVKVKNEFESAHKRLHCFFIDNFDDMPEVWSMNTRML